jgi:hypothetical protein
VKTAKVAALVPGNRGDGLGIGEVSLVEGETELAPMPGQNEAEFIVFQGPIMISMRATFILSSPTRRHITATSGRPGSSYNSRRFHDQVGRDKTTVCWDPQSFGAIFGGIEGVREGLPVWRPHSRNIVPTDLGVQRGFLVAQRAIIIGRHRTIGSKRNR